MRVKGANGKEGSMTYEEASKYLDGGKTIAVGLGDYFVDSVTVREGFCCGMGTPRSPEFDRLKKKSEGWYVVNEDYLKAADEAVAYLEGNGWLWDSDSMMFKDFGTIGLVAEIDFHERHLSLSAIDWWYGNDLYPALDTDDAADMGAFKAAYRRTVEDFEHAMDLLEGIPMKEFPKRAE